MGEREGREQEKKGSKRISRRESAVQNCRSWSSLEIPGCAGAGWAQTLQNPHQVFQNLLNLQEKLDSNETY